jgi:STE24 endopeptidase
MSKNTKKANAAFTGLGKTKRIILGDTLVTGFTEDEILTVFAHELGHYKKGHIKIFISLPQRLRAVYHFKIYSTLLPCLGLSIQGDRARPSCLIIGLISLTKPIGSYISRRFEFEADRYA